MENEAPGTFSVKESSDGVMVCDFDVCHHKKTDGPLRKNRLWNTLQARTNWSKLCRFFVVIVIATIIFVVFHTVDKAVDKEPEPDLDFLVPDVAYENLVDNLPVQSISAQNIQNIQGHYLHDALVSPYASKLYASNHADKKLITKIQGGFDTQRATYSDLFGHVGWGRVPSQPQSESGAIAAPEHVTDKQLSSVRYRDWKNDDLPSDAWQKDAEYLMKFLQNSKHLVDIMKEAIYEEYGFGTKLFPSGESLEYMIPRRKKEFEVIVEDGLLIEQGSAVDRSQKRIPGIAYMNKKAWEGLVRKLLHAMMTNGEFYVVVAGNSNAYYGNNLFQTQIMQFNYILEPVLEKLGVRLISRNMAMDATTSITALGGADLYGEADILWYIPDNESVREADLLHKQSILSGERVPIVLTPYPTSLWEATEHEIWMGNIQPGASFCDHTIKVEDKVILPNVKACSYVNCETDPINCENKNSVCWIDRTDVKLSRPQDEDVGHQKEGYDGVLKHRLEGRKMAMMVLRALDQALNRWKDRTRGGAVPLPESEWHVGGLYEKVRDKVRQLRNSECEKFLRKADPRICYTEMHAASEWTPRVHPEGNSLRNLLVEPVLDNKQHEKEIYNTFDLLPVSWKPSNDEMDVHMVALLSEVSHGRRVKQDFAHRRLLNNDLYKLEDISGQRQLGFSGISEKGWTLYNAPKGFCDGSAQSQCNRVPSNKCLLANYNHYRSGLIGHGSSGPLKLSVPRVRKGLILARFDWEQMDEDGKTDGPRVKTLPYDFQIDITVDGKRTIRWDRGAFAKHSIDVVGGLRLHMILNDSSFDGPRDVRVDIEVVSSYSISKATPLVFLSHIYWA